MKKRKKGECDFLRGRAFEYAPAGGCSGAVSDISWPKSGATVACSAIMNINDVALGAHTVWYSAFKAEGHGLLYYTECRLPSEVWQACLLKFCGERGLGLENWGY